MSEDAFERAPQLRIESSEDPVRRYFKEIGKYPLLNAEQEVALAQRRDEGTAAMAALEQQPDLSQQEIYDLELYVWDGEVAKQELTQANLRLVVSIAKRYTGYANMPLLDLIQEGNFGLMKAAEKFDGQKGFKFSTYATWWIRQSITRSIHDTGTTIRIPVHMGEQINKLKKVTRDFAQQNNGRLPTTQELALILEVEPVKVLELQAANDLKNIGALDKPVGLDDDGSTTLIDILADTDSDRPFEKVVTYFPDGIQPTLKSFGLTQREIEVLSLRYGIDDGVKRTLEEVGKMYGVTRERIRQIEQRARQKAYHHITRMHIRDDIMLAGTEVTEAQISIELARRDRGGGRQTRR